MNTVIDLGAYKHIHFIGIGGVSMSGLAEMMHARGVHVTGSDRSDSPLVQHLRDSGIEVQIGHNAENVHGAELVVYTAAVKQDNPERMEAERLQIRQVERAPFLGALMRDYSLPIGIAGTHGKTSTTSMIAHTMCSAGLDPTVSVGASLKSIGGNFRIGGKDTFVFEACEYVDSFLSFFPKIAVILNIEPDHLDYFSGIEDEIRSFAKFASITGGDGFVVVNGDSDNALKALEDYSGTIITYSLSDEKADYYGRASIGKSGYPEISVYERGREVGFVSLKVPGMHNASNALAAIAVLRLCKMDFGTILEGLSYFTGADRRFQYKGKYHGATVVDDYAHHPTEIAATLTAAADMPFSRVVTVFQPHTYSRTQALFNEFAEVLQKPDVLILMDIYEAREKKSDYNVTSDDLAAKIPGAHICHSFEECRSLLANILREDDICLTMGAGDVYKIGEELIYSEEH